MNSTTPIKNLDEFLFGISIGVRFRANFAIEDRLGEIVDTILYSENSFFSPSVFPEVVSGIDNRKILKNEKTGDLLHIDNSNLVLEVFFQSAEGVFEQKSFSRIIEAFNKQIIAGVMREFKIKEIARIGYIRKYLFKIEDLARAFVGKTIGNSLGGINDIDLRFSKKIPSAEGTVKQNVNDYFNAIFNVIKKANRDEIYMSVDFQKFFDPFLPSYSEIDLLKFVEEATSFNQKSYLPWLNSNFVEGSK